MGGPARREQEQEQENEQDWRLRARHGNSERVEKYRRKCLESLTSAVPPICIGAAQRDATSCEMWNILPVNWVFGKKVFPEWQTSC